MENSQVIEQKKSFQIDPIDASQAQRLGRLARTIYPQHYTHLWHDAGEWYVQTNFEPKRLEQELSDSNARFFIATDSEGRDLGFLKINLHTPLSKNALNTDYFEQIRFYEDIQFSDNALELERIYLLKEAQGTGLGKILTEMTFQIAKDLGRDCVWLKVMDSSFVPLKFYKKMGFTLCGEMRLKFDKMKRDFRGMYMMKGRIA
jgi:diamine N-acetyltransferase